MLTNKQAMFVKEYMVDLNATQAAIRAGYSEKTAGQMGDENLKKPQIADAIKEAMQQRAEKVSLTAENVLQSILDIRAIAVQGEKLNEALRANELLGKHLKLFTDKTELTGKDGAPIETVTEVVIRPQITREEWLAIHGMDSPARSTVSRT